MKKKILTIIGARPQFIKAAVLSRFFKGHPLIEEIIVHTGQHFDSNMSDVFFEQLNIPQPRYYLDIHSLSHGAMTGLMLEKLEEIMLQELPSLVLIYGDTNSTLAGALAASKLHIPIAHIEAGLRSFNPLMPEEINRVLSDHVSSLLFCPTLKAVENLSQEGITKNVFHVGDVMHDATLFAIEKISKKILLRFELKEKSYIVLTLHRQESTANKEHLENLLNYIIEYSKNHSLQIVWPIHPRTKSLVKAEIFDLIKVIDPLNYQDMHSLLHFSSLVCTDSGGLQKEAYFHQKPCITMRSETEWTETITNGWNRLWSVPQYVLPQQSIKDYGDGKAGSIIFEKIETFLGNN
ncbi:MAG: UDP-N-acetylglucosamine 2-epimerase [Caedibacter sp. 37-49]|nr:MAG: UDP-N-acetylglucosamine 2-epimerase [Caedibacter sp. 37-49]